MYFISLLSSNIITVSLTNVAMMITIAKYNRLIYSPDKIEDNIIVNMTT